MTDHLDRAVEAVSRAIHEEDANASMSGVPWPEWDDLDTEGRLAYVPVAEGVLEALDAAGLLVTPERDAAVAAKTLREAAEAIADTDGTGWPYGPVIDWLHDRADRIEVRGLTEAENGPQKTQGESR